MTHAKIDHYEHHHRSEHESSALDVAPGVESAPTVNPNFRRTRKRALTTDDFVEGILRGDTTTLSQAITLVESNNPQHFAQAQAVVERCLPHAGRSVRVGITGVPGAGKSTFIEAVGGMVADGGHRLAVLAIDPSSERSGGSILGDRTRMETISAREGIFIRPSPSAGSLGGVARKTRETVVLCEAAGYDVVFIETVGVGQSEVAVHSMVDMFMMLQISGAGDELQGIKRGIMEMADIAVVTKADGENVEKAQLAKSYLANALALFPMPDSGRRPRVFTCSSVTREGLRGIWDDVEEFVAFTRANGYFETNRRRQNKYWMWETIDAALRGSFFGCGAVAEALPDFERRVGQGLIGSFTAARELLGIYFENIMRVEG